MLFRSQQIANLQAKKARGLVETREVDSEVRKIMQQKVAAAHKKESPARLQAIVANAKDRINNGQIGEAKLLVKEAEMLLNKIKDADVRRSYGYDVKELKMNIKLAILV